LSGINSLLDTLLHQVLGKRVDLPVAHSLVPPLQEIARPEALRAPQADARLEGRPATSAAPAQGSAQPAGRTFAEAEQQRQAPIGAAPLEQAVVTRLSAPAQLIAQVLARHPRPPPPLRALQPLLTLGEASPRGELASRLQAAIDSSGLFYESHLARWYGGAIDRQQLAAEPQMRHGDTRQAGAPLAPELQGLVRQQLELLATPVVRWEGELWPGAALALLLTPDDAPTGGEWDDAAGDQAESDAWISELELAFERLGVVTTRLRLDGARLDLVIEVESAELCRRLGAAADWLAARLTAQGFAQTSVRIAAREVNDDGH